MKNIKDSILVIVLLLIIEQLNIFHVSSEKMPTSIITFFCLKNVKSEMQKANLKYEKKVGIETCDCYLQKISTDISHEDSISQCKIETQRKFNL